MRLYFYSSGTIFGSITTPLTEWLLQDKTNRSTLLTKLSNDIDNDLYKILSEVIFLFVKHKKQPFPSATLSQQDFWAVPWWKRACVFVFVYRYVMEKHVTKQYTKWRYVACTIIGWCAGQSRAPENTLGVPRMPPMVVCCMQLTHVLVLNHVYCMQIACVLHVCYMQIALNKV